MCFAVSDTTRKSQINFVLLLGKAHQMMSADKMISLKVATRIGSCFALVYVYGFFTCRSLPLLAVPCLLLGFAEVICLLIGVACCSLLAAWLHSHPDVLERI